MCFTNDENIQKINALAISLYDFALTRTCNLFFEYCTYCRYFDPHSITASNKSLFATASERQRKDIIFYFEGKDQKSLLYALTVVT